MASRSKSSEAHQIPETPTAALGRAISKPKIDIEECRGLLDAGADANGRGSTRDTFLHEAIWKDSLELSKLLLDRGAKLEARGNLHRTPLHLAAMMGRLEICRYLLERGAKIEARGAKGETPLHLATWPRGGAAVCQLLLDVGANLTAKTDNGDYAAHRAARYGGVDACAFLANLGFGPAYTPDQADTTYLTPFQAAVENGNIATARYYIETYGEDLAQRTLAGRTLIQLAGKQNPDMKAFLRSAKTGLAIHDSIDDGVGEASHPSPSAPENERSTGPQVKSRTMSPI